MLLEDDRETAGLRSTGEMEAARETGVDGAGVLASETLREEAGVLTGETLLDGTGDRPQPGADLDL